MIDIGLWGEEFSIKENNTKDILKKVKNKKVESEVSIEKKLKSKVIPIEEKLRIIEHEVKRVLGRQATNQIMITSREALHNYISNALKYKEIAIDTETNNSLDALTCKLLGVCLYVPNCPQAYVPINHRDYKTKERLNWQLTEKDIYDELSRLIDQNIEIYGHNWKFDYKVLKCTTGLVLPATWDSLIAARLIDESDGAQAGLKQLYIKFIDPDQEKYKIDKLFSGIELVDSIPEIFAYYAATDARETYELVHWQKDYLNQPDESKVLNLFNTVEMPLVQVLAEMELTGIKVDRDFAARLSAKYHKKSEEVERKIALELLELAPIIDAWKVSPRSKLVTPSKSGAVKNPKMKIEQLSDPIELSSPTQLAILLYDILEVPVVDKSDPRGTGEPILSQLVDKYPICKLILEKKSIDKMLNAFIDTLPNMAGPDGKIHCSFRQCGADTGRLSCTEPNLQQAPGHGDEMSIRCLFAAEEGYTFVGSDFKSQEVRVLAGLSGDEQMIQAFKEEKDLYAYVASIAFDKPYEECMEFNPKTGEKQVEGKERRSQAKSIVLGIMYARGASSIAEQIHKSREEAQQIIDQFYSSFPAVKRWTDQNIESAHTKGYVEDFMGRKRHLPDAMLPRYEFSYINNVSAFNPFLGVSNKDIKVSDKEAKYYTEQMDKCWGNKQREVIKQKAAAKGIKITNNQGFIARADRQTTNARIQGSSATMMKMCLNKIFRDDYLNNLGCKLVNTVHDELMVECPKENAQKVSDRIGYIMSHITDEYLPVGMGSDPYIVDHWMADELSYRVWESYDKEIESGKSKEDALNIIYNRFSELTKDSILKSLETRTILEI